VQAYTVLSAESVTDAHPGRPYFEERYATLRGEIADAFHAICAQRGIVDPGDVTAASAAILAVMDGLQVQWLLAPGDLDLGRSSAFAIEALVRAVLGDDVDVLEN
jgi:AcrR family transcriptional regulator